MPNHLVIVESPTKAKTIKRFLGKDFTVEASMGHVRDLPSSKLSIDVDDNFEASYVVPKEKAAVVKKLQKELDAADSLWIATDEDREGEAIGWHLLEVLKRKHKQNVQRIVFHEITKDAIDAAVANPRQLDDALVEAQQARRILDRLVGYTLSPFLWKKVYRGLSAGRVQSVAVKIIVDREREIQAFNPVEYWTIGAALETGKQESFVANLKDRDGQKFLPTTKEESDEVVSAVENAEWSVKEIEEKELKRTPPPPFTTSTLQQEAGRKLGFSVKQTMVIAQQLYEGIDLGKGEGQVGLITYMRTDSVNLSEKALKDARAEIEKLYGREYVLSEPRKYKTKSAGAQEAHEAIRPSEMARTPESLKEDLDHTQLKLYTLIWNRTMATQMPPAELKRVGADITAGRYTFRATGQTVAFDGYFRVYLEGRDESADTYRSEKDEEDDENRLPPLAVGDALKLSEVKPEQHFTKPPPRYTEASLVKKLEEEGIGRPSTYAPTIATVQQRGYIKKEGKQLQPEEIAFTVTDLLAEHFTDIVDLGFTATMEQSLDDIAEKKVGRVEFLKGFFVPFKKRVDEKTEAVTKDDVLKERVLGKDPATGLEVIARTGRFGPYVQLGRIEEMPEIADDGKKKKPTKSKKPVKVKREKPKSASIPKNLTKDDITLEQALSLLCFPRIVGMKDGENVEVNLGRFGPYVRCGKVTASIPADTDPATLTFEGALTVIAQAKERRKQEAEPLKILGNDPVSGGQILVKTGRYGPYVTDGKTNASVNKKISPEELTHEQAVEILAKKRERGPGRRWGKKK